jgi:THO complex subunit 5
MQPDHSLLQVGELLLALVFIVHLVIRSVHVDNTTQHPPSRILARSMVLPSSISDPSPLDPLLLVPLPAVLPTSPLPSLPPLISALDSHLTTLPNDAPNTDALPIPLLTTQMRQVTRSGQVLLNAARHGAAEAREGLDRVDVELRGVEYERERVREEIALCGDYA